MSRTLAEIIVVESEAHEWALLMQIAAEVLLVTPGCIIRFRSNNALSAELVRLAGGGVLKAAAVVNLHPTAVQQVPSNLDLLVPWLDCTSACCCCVDAQISSSKTS